MLLFYHCVLENLQLLCWQTGVRSGAWPALERTVTLCLVSFALLVSMVSPSCLGHLFILYLGKVILFIPLRVHTRLVFASFSWYKEWSFRVVRFSENLYFVKMSKLSSETLFPGFSGLTLLDVYLGGFRPFSRLPHRGYHENHTPGTHHWQMV